MRIIKLSMSEFNSMAEITEFFMDDLPTRDIPNTFHLTSGRIAKDGLKIGEPLLFTFRSRVVYLARSASTRRTNLDQYRSKYPNYFIVDHKSLRRVNIALQDVENELHRAGFYKNFVVSQGWPFVEDTPITNGLFEKWGGV